MYLSEIAVTNWTELEIHDGRFIAWVYFTSRYNLSHTYRSQSSREWTIKVWNFLVIFLFHFLRGQIFLIRVLLCISHLLSRKYIKANSLIRRLKNPKAISKLKVINGSKRWHWFKREFLIPTLKINLDVFHPIPKHVFFIFKLKIFLLRFSPLNYLRLLLYMYLNYEWITIIFRWASIRTGYTTYQFEFFQHVQYL